MGGGLDDSIDLLRAFCDLLRNTNPVLESGATELGQRGDDLRSRAMTISNDVQTLAGDLVQLVTETNSAETSTVKACNDLGAAAETVTTDQLGQLSEGSAALQVRWTQSLRERASGLTAALAELGSAGCQPLQATVEDGRDRLQHWIDGAETALGGFAKLIATLDDDVDHAVHGAVQEGDAMRYTPGLFDTYWSEEEANHERLTELSQHGFPEAENKAGLDHLEAYNKLTAEVGTTSGQVRTQLQQMAQKVADAIDGQAGEIAQLLQTAADALDKAQLELERAVVQAETAQEGSRELTDLADKAVNAETLRQQIDAALQELEP